MGIWHQAKMFVGARLDSIRVDLATFRQEEKQARKWPAPEPVVKGNTDELSRLVEEAFLGLTVQMTWPSFDPPLRDVRIRLCIQPAEDTVERAEIQGGQSTTQDGKAALLERWRSLDVALYQSALKRLNQTEGLVLELHAEPDIC
jgi:hypothetical protein